MVVPTGDAISAAPMEVVVDLDIEVDVTATTAATIVQWPSDDTHACLDVRNIARERGGDYFIRDPPGQLHGVGADVPGRAMDEDSLRRVYRSVLNDHLPCGACDDWY